MAESALQQDMHHFYSSHHGWLFAWLRKKLGCPDNAADVAQDTFLRIIASRDALLGMQEPRAYLTTTAKRLIYDRSRRQLIEQAYLAELTLAAESICYPDPQEILLAVEALAQISAALQDVSENARTAFLLHYLEGLTQTEVAAELGVSTRMVLNYLTQTLVKCHLAQA